MTEPVRRDEPDRDDQQHDDQYVELACRLRRDRRVRVDFVLALQPLGREFVDPREDDARTGSRAAAVPSSSFRRPGRHAECAKEQVARLQKDPTCHGVKRGYSKDIPTFQFRQQRHQSSLRPAKQTQG